MGAFLALLAAASFGLNAATLRRGVRQGSVLQALAITVPMGVPLFAAAALYAGALHLVLAFPPRALFWFSAAGVVHFVAGRYGNYRATRAMGAILAGPVQQTSVLVALILALVFLDESLTPLRIAGIVLVVIGPVVMLGGRGAGPAAANDATTDAARPATARFRPNYVEGYAFSLLCALGYGTSPLLIRLGLEGGGVGVSLAGGVVSYAAASLAIAPILLLPGNLGHVRTLEPATARWFAASGALVFLSQMFRYMALSLAPVTVVVPIQRASVVFRVIFGWILNRDHEVFGPRVLLGIAVSLTGAVALTISAEFVLDLVGAPDALAAIVRWRWP